MRAFKKFCNLTVKGNGIIANCHLFSKLYTTEFRAFVALFCLTVYAINYDFYNSVLPARLPP